MLTWKIERLDDHPAEWYEAILGDFKGDDGVRFSIQDMPTNNIRGRHRLLIEVSDHTHRWPAFDLNDQPMRYYHEIAAAKSEAEAIAAAMSEVRNRRESSGFHPACR